MNMKQRYTVIHEHRHGVSSYTVQCGHFPTEDEVIEHCYIDFDPVLGEVITIAPDNENDVVDIP